MPSWLQAIIDFFTGLFGPGTAPVPDGVEISDPNPKITSKYPGWHQYDAFFKTYASIEGIDWTHLKAISIVESALGKYRDGYDGLSTGLMHLIETTANDMGDELGLNKNITLDDLHDDDHLSIQLAAHYHGKSVKMFPGNIGAQVRSYNMGWGNTRKWIAGTGPDYSETTSGYFEKWEKALGEVLSNK